LAGGLAPGGGQDLGLDPACLLVSQDASGLSDQPGPGAIDDPLVQGPGGTGQPDSQVQGQIKIGPGGAGRRGEGRPLSHRQ
jgi:hypothetical protein